MESCAANEPFRDREPSKSRRLTMSASKVEPLVLYRDITIVPKNWRVHSESFSRLPLESDITPPTRVGIVTGKRRGMLVHLANRSARLFGAVFGFAMSRDDAVEVSRRRAGWFCVLCNGQHHATPLMCVAFLRFCCMVEVFGMAWVAKSVVAARWHSLLWGCCVRFASR